MSAINQLVATIEHFWDSKTDKIIDNADGWEERANDELSYNPDEHEGKTVDEVREELIRYRFDDFLSAVRLKADEDKGKLIVYRCISPDDVDEFIFHVANGEAIEGYDGLGIFWSFDEKKAGCHWGSGSSGRSHGDVTIHALVSVGDINVERTVMANLFASTGEEEAEITLKEGAKLEVIGIQTDEAYVSPLDEGHPAIPMTAIKAYEERPFPVGPEPDGGFNKEDQLVEVGMPEMNRVELKEALLVRPYYLGEETRFMPDECKYPAMHRILKPEFADYPTVEKTLKEEVPIVEPEDEDGKTEV